ncbi:MAG: RluA family pseudouridine synthase [Puniceicoccales bacterium]|jgi:23S rRNA pseudouridine1911/1915/1917 synthase|nr:RluA family pseudouridine synthase [Puniceicoccales bacterium]
MIKIVAQNLDIPVRADKFLAAQFHDVSRTQIKRSFDDGLVLCNGQAIKAKQFLRSGDILEIELIYPRQTTLCPHDMPLEVLFEDEHLIIVNKPVGVAVHVGNGMKEPALVEWVLAHCELSGIGGEFRPGVVHRLDKNTTGAIIFAKTDRTYLKLVRLFSTRAIQKEYLAIVCGAMRTLSGTIDQPIGRHKSVKTKMCIHSAGKPALTDWRIQERFGELFSLISINLHTGRTHQIRVHMASIGHPLLGDATYGYNPNFCPKIQCERPMLHASKLSFVHPITLQSLVIKAPLPIDFISMVSNLKKLES